MSEMGNVTTPIAGKTHPCMWCPDPIKVGEKYSRIKGKWNGEWQNWAMHSECLDKHYEETDGGEICQERHDRGKTCDETQRKEEE